MRITEQTDLRNPIQVTNRPSTSWKNVHIVFYRYPILTTFSFKQTCTGNISQPHLQFYLIVSEKIKVPQRSEQDETVMYHRLNNYGKSFKYNENLIGDKSVLVSCNS